MKRHTKNNAGNVLFLILIAVVLFAALAFVFSSSGRVQGDTSPRERSRLKGSEILNFAGNVEQGLTRAKLTNGCADNAIRFKHDALSSDYENTSNTPADKTCYIFDSIGEKVPYQAPPTTVLSDAQTSEPDFGTYTFSGANTVENVGTTGTAQIILFLPYLREDVCKQVNVLLNINAPLGDPIEDADGFIAVDSAARFSGTFATTAQIDAGGQKSGCLKATDIGGGAGGPFYVFFHVISQR